MRYTTRLFTFVVLAAVMAGCERISASQITEARSKRSRMDGFATAAARTANGVPSVPALRAAAVNAVARAMGPDSAQVWRGLMSADPTSIMILPPVGDTVMERVVSQYADALDREFPGYKLVYLRNLAESRGLSGAMELRAISPGAR